MAKVRVELGKAAEDDILSALEPYLTSNEGEQAAEPVGGSVDVEYYTKWLLSQGRAMDAVMQLLTSPISLDARLAGTNKVVLDAFRAALAQLEGEDKEHVEQFFDNVLLELLVQVRSPDVDDTELLVGLTMKHDIV